MKAKKVGPKEAKKYLGKVVRVVIHGKLIENLPENKIVLRTSTGDIEVLPDQALELLD